MKITKIIAAFMLAGFISIAGCDTATEVPAGGPDPMETSEQMEAEMGDMEDPGEGSEEAPAEEAPAEEAPAEEAPAEGDGEG